MSIFINTYDKQRRKMNFRIQKGSVFLEGVGDRYEFTLSYRDKFLKVEHRFVNRSTFYDMIIDRVENLKPNEDVAFIKACKEQILHGGETL